MNQIIPSTGLTLRLQQFRGDPSLAFPSCQNRYPGTKSSNERCERALFLRPFSNYLHKTGSTVAIELTTTLRAATLTLFTVAFGTTTLVTTALLG
jgi:hypothetical protein